MPEAIDAKGEKAPKRSSISIARSGRMLSLSRIYYVGAALIKLRTLERKADKATRQLDPLPVLDRIPALFTLVKTYDMILDRRRILCGDPLPGKGQGKPQRTVHELEPITMEPVPEPESVPEVAKPDPESGVD